MRNFVVYAGGCALLALAGAAQASSQIQAAHNGWYNARGFHDAAIVNVFTGLNDTEYRSYFEFDLTGASAASAISITFYANGVFATDTGAESASFFDYTGSIDSLLTATRSLPTFDDLGSGALLGAHAIAAPDGSAMPQFTVNLSDAFVQQFNTALGSADRRIALGGALTTLDLAGVPQAFWSRSDLSTAAFLTVEAAQSASAPEPAAWAMMLAGFGLAGAALRRRRGALTASKIRRAGANGAPHAS
jgi:hypothetical protein